MNFYFITWITWLKWCSGSHILNHLAILPLAWKVLSIFSFKKKKTKNLRPILLAEQLWEEVEPGNYFRMKILNVLDRTLTLYLSFAPKIPSPKAHVVAGMLEERIPFYTYVSFNCWSLYLESHGSLLPSFLSAELQLIS